MKNTQIQILYYISLDFVDFTNGFEFNLLIKGNNPNIYTECKIHLYQLLDTNYVFLINNEILCRELKSTAVIKELDDQNNVSLSVLNATKYYPFICYFDTEY